MAGPPGRPPAVPRTLARLRRVAEFADLAPTERALALARRPSVDADALPIPDELRAEADRAAGDDDSAWGRYLAVRVAGHPARFPAAPFAKWVRDYIETPGEYAHSEACGAARAVAETARLSERNLRRIAANKRKAVDEATMDKALTRCGSYRTIRDLYPAEPDDDEIRELRAAIAAARKRQDGDLEEIDRLRDQRASLIERLATERRELAGLRRGWLSPIAAAIARARRPLPFPADPRPMLRTFREAHGLSQAGLAQRAGTSERTIRRAEAGHRPARRARERIAAALAAPEQAVFPPRR